MCSMLARSSGVSSVAGASAKKQNNMAETDAPNTAIGERSELLRWASDTLAVDLQTIKQVADNIALQP